MGVNKILLIKQTQPTPSDSDRANGLAKSEPWSRGRQTRLLTWKCGNEGDETWTFCRSVPLLASPSSLLKHACIFFFWLLSLYGVVFSFQHKLYRIKIHNNVLCLTTLFVSFCSNKWTKIQTISCHRRAMLAKRFPFYWSLLTHLWWVCLSLSLMFLFVMLAPWKKKKGKSDR